MEVKHSSYKTIPTVTLKNSAGMQLRLSALGAGIMSVRVPDRYGTPREVTKLPGGGYGSNYHGMTIGRTAGRIDSATFTIDGRTALLEKNNYGKDNLHGGRTGLHTRVFSVRVKRAAAHTDVVFCYDSPSGEGGYFGDVKISVTYRVMEKSNAFYIIFRGEPSEKTLLDLTNHAYFNVSGDLREPVTDQYLYINASRVGELNERLIMRDIKEVSEEFDFRTPKPFGTHVFAPAVQQYTKGYDHPFLLDKRGLEHEACSLYSQLSGIKLSVSTTYPCVVVFGDNFEEYRSLTFECQFLPDGIHSCPEDCGVCSPAEPYEQTVKYDFTVEK